MTRSMIVLVVLVILLSACSGPGMSGAGSPVIVIESPERRALIATAQAIGNTAEARRVYLEKTKGGAP